MLNKCHVGGQTLSGQDFHTDNWNVIVRQTLPSPSTSKGGRDPVFEELEDYMYFGMHFPVKSYDTCSGRDSALYP
jgi:hypothetical protein